MNPIQIIALLGGAYLLYSYLVSASAPAASTTTTTGAAPATTAPTFTYPTAAQLQNAAGGATALTVWQWNYYYGQITGHSTASWGPGVGPFANISTTQQISASQFLATLQGAGLSGLGDIINLTELYKAASPGSGFGDEEFIASGKGMGMIVDDANNGPGYIDEGVLQEAAQFGTPDGTDNDFYAAAEGQGS